MTTTRWQKMIFAFITVVITVHLFVFYNLSYVSGLSLSQLERDGVSVLGHSCRVWTVLLIEFVCAYLLELFVGSPYSLKLAMRVVNPKENQPFVVETAIICATVGIMCPAMSLIATWLYHDVTAMTPAGFLATWLRTIMHNFPLAFFSQLFFIQPLVRAVYRQLAKVWSRPENGIVPEISQ